MSMKRKHPITGCQADDLFGIWVIEPEICEQLKNLVLATDLSIFQTANSSSPENESDLGYIKSGPVAVIELSGAVTKRPTSFRKLTGGFSTLESIASIRQAYEDPSIDRILLRVDSPGGTELGLDDLSRYIRKVDQKKPIYTHADDRMLSAAFWFGSSGREVTASANSWIGSIGAYTVLKDTSGKWEKEGIKLYTVASGKKKGLGADGKVTPEVIAKYAEECSQLTDLFVRRVAENRNLSVDKVRELADGSKFMADKAKSLGLIDRVSTYEDVLANLQGKSAPLGYRGPMGERGKIAASDKRSTAMPFTAEQLKQVRNLPGAASVSEEDVEVKVLEIATSLNTQVATLTTQLEQKNVSIRDLQAKLPRDIPAEVLAGHARLALKEVDLLGKEGKLLGGQVDYLKKLMMPEEGKPNSALFADAGNGDMVYTKLLGVFETNKPNGLNKELSGSQPAPRSEPGAKENTKRPSLSRLNQLRKDRGLAVMTKDEYEASEGDFSPEEVKD